MARTRAVLNLELLKEINGTSFLWCLERGTMVPLEVCLHKCQEKCPKFTTYIESQGVV